VYIGLSYIFPFISYNIKNDAFKRLVLIVLKFVRISLFKLAFQNER